MQDRMEETERRLGEEVASPQVDSRRVHHPPEAIGDATHISSGQEPAVGPTGRATPPGDQTEETGCRPT